MLAGGAGVTDVHLPTVQQGVPPGEYPAVVIPTGRSTRGTSVRQTRACRVLHVLPMSMRIYWGYSPVLHGLSRTVNMVILVQTVNLYTTGYSSTVGQLYGLLTDRCPDSYPWPPNRVGTARITLIYQ